MDMSDDKLLRKKGVEAMLGISRATLGRIIKNDPKFPKFIELSAGIHLVRARDIRVWFVGKELEAREKSINAQVDKN